MTELARSMKGWVGRVFCSKEKLFFLEAIPWDLQLLKPKALTELSQELRQGEERQVKERLDLSQRTALDFERPQFTPQCYCNEL